MTEPTTSVSNEAPEYQKRDRSKKPLIITIALLVVAVLVAAGIFWLNRGTGAETPGGEGSGGTGGSGGVVASRELTVGLQLEPGNFDIRNTGGVALDQILIDNVYQGLVGLASGSVDRIVPVLAESLPKISDDGLSYTFALRKDARFHSGNALTAADVVASLKAQGGQSLGEQLGTPFEVTAPDEHTVVIKLQTPNSQLLWQLSNRAGLITEAAYTGDPQSTTNGTGPYRLETWKQRDSITFVAVDGYWGGAPSLDRVVWRYFTDANSAVNAALEGDLDVLAPVTPSLASQLEGGNLELGHAASTDVFTLAYNNAKAPLNDPRVRTALSKAVDSNAIIQAFYGDGKALGSPVTDLEAAYEDLTRINAYDPEGAKALLAEAGSTGLELTLTIANFYDLAPVNQLVSQFAAVGVTLNINQVEFNTWLADVYRNHDFDLSYVNHAEPNDFANYTNPKYYFGYDSAAVQDLFAQSVKATDPAKAIDLKKQAVRLVAEDAPAKWLINYTPTNAIAKHVKGFPKSNTNSRINLDGVTVQ